MYGLDKTVFSTFFKVFFDSLTHMATEVKLSHFLCEMGSPLQLILIKRIPENICKFEVSHSSELWLQKFNFEHEDENSPADLDAMLQSCRQGSRN